MNIMILFQINKIIRPILIDVSARHSVFHNVTEHPPKVPQTSCGSAYYKSLGITVAQGSNVYVLRSPRLVLWAKTPSGTLGNWYLALRYLKAPS